MPSPIEALPAVEQLTMLDEIASVLASPISEVASFMSGLLERYVSHSALLLLTLEDVGQPRKSAGDKEITRTVTLEDLDLLRDRVPAGDYVRDEIRLGRAIRPVLAVVSHTNGILVLTDPGPGGDELVLRLWEIMALRIQRHAREASPTYLIESRSASSVRAEAVTEIADRHTTTLESLLAVLRSTSLDDRQARATATGLAMEAAVHLRTATDRVLTFNEEAVTSAFERLQVDLRPLVRYRDVDVQFVEPPVDGRALPSEVAHGARAVVRDAILALMDQPDVARIRVQWDCDGKNLLVNVRDDGPGDLSMESLQLQPLRQRVVALDGRISLAATSGWGSEMSVVMPLDPPPLRHDNSRLAGLTVREHQIVGCVVAGLRNRAIATELGISENTVKFHLAKIFRKLDVTSRAALATLALRLGEKAFVAATKD